MKFTCPHCHKYSDIEVWKEGPDYGVSCQSCTTILRRFRTRQECEAYLYELRNQQMQDLESIGVGHVPPTAVKPPKPPKPSKSSKPSDPSKSPPAKPAEPEPVIPAAPAVPDLDIVSATEIMKLLDQARPPRPPRSPFSLATSVGWYRQAQSGSQIMQVPAEGAFQIPPGFTVEHPGGRGVSVPNGWITASDPEGALIGVDWHNFLPDAVLYPRTLEEASEALRRFLGHHTLAWGANSAFPSGWVVFPIRQTVVGDAGNGAPRAYRRIFHLFAPNGRRVGGNYLTRNDALEGAERDLLFDAGLHPLEGAERVLLFDAGLQSSPDPALVHDPTPLPEGYDIVHDKAHPEGPPYHYLVRFQGVPVDEFTSDPNNHEPHWAVNSEKAWSHRLRAATGDSAWTMIWFPVAEANTHLWEAIHAPTGDILLGEATTGGVPTAAEAYAKALDLAAEMRPAPPPVDPDIDAAMQAIKQRRIPPRRHPPTLAQQQDWYRKAEAIAGQRWIVLTDTAVDGWVPIDSITIDGQTTPCTYASEAEAWADVDDDIAEEQRQCDAGEREDVTDREGFMVVPYDPMVHDEQWRRATGQDVA